jgi:hypothetical protein
MKTDEIKKRLEAATKIPYRKFPIVLVGHGEEKGEYLLINEYLDLGMSYLSDVPQLLEAHEIMREALETYKDIRVEGDDGLFFDAGSTAREALQKIEELGK